MNVYPEVVATLFYALFFIALALWSVAISEHPKSGTEQQLKLVCARLKQKEPC
jgi:hypothetical protein